MGNPITWQNVTSAPAGNAAQFMQLAQNGMDGAFDKFGAVLKQKETTDQANWETEKSNNTRAFLDQMSQYRTPQEFQAAQLSGKLDSMRQGFGAQIDSTTARNAENSQLARLQQSVTANNTFNDSTLDRQQLPERERLTLQALQGAPGAAEAIANSDLRVKSDVMKTVVDRSRQAVTDTQTAAKAASELLTDTSTREHTAAQTGVLNSQVTDTLLNRSLANRVATSGLETATKIGEAQTKFGALAASLGMPVSRGFVDTDTLTTAQKKALDAAGEKAGMGTFSDIPTMGSAFRSISGDLAKESPDAARVVAANQDAYLTQFKASGITTEYGAHQDRQDKFLAKAKARNVYNDDKGNPALSSTDMVEEIQKYVKTAVPKDNQEAMLKQMSKHIAKGYSLPDGTVVPYPLGAVKEAINQTDYPWVANFWGIRDKSGDATSRLDEWMKQPANTDRIVEGLGTISSADRKLFTDDLLAKGGATKTSGGKKTSSPMRSGMPPGYKSPVTTVKNPAQ